MSSKLSWRLAWRAGHAARSLSPSRTRGSRRSPAAFAALALIVIGAGCFSSSDEPGTLEVGIHAKRPPSLAPFGGSGWLPEAIAELIYDGGFNRELQGESFEPSAALFEKSYERWDASYYVRLARGARFAAAPGFVAREVVPDDVVFSYSVLRRKGLGTRMLPNSFLQGVRLSDRPGWDLRFVFSEDPGKEAFFDVAAAKVVPKPPEGVRTSAWLEQLERWPIGTGPYQVASFGETLLLERHVDRGWGSKPRYDRIRIRFSEIVGSLEQDFLSRRLAVYAGAWPPDLLEIPGAGSPLQSQSAPAERHYAIALNTSAGVLAELAARRAVLALIEPETLIRTVVPDPRASVSYSAWPQAYLRGNLGMRPASLAALVPPIPDAPRLEADLELIWQEEPEDKRLTGLLARRLSELVERTSQGKVHLGRLHGLDPASFRLRLQQKRYDLALVRLDIDEVPERLKSGPAEQNYTGLQDQQIDELALRWPRAEDQDERRAIVRALTKRLAMHAAWCWLFTPVYRIYFDTERMHMPPGGIREMMQAVETW